MSYVKTETRSNGESTTIPSTPTQVAFAHELMAELKEIGMSEVKYNDKNGYVTALLPSNLDHEVETVGFLSHIDTADFNAKNINPRIIENYDGKSTIKLDDAGEFVLDLKTFPNLAHYNGADLIVTDGSTLLGADDKAGVTEIMTAMEFLLTHPEVKHGPVKIGFGPDEEIGTGADHFDVPDFKADFAYTVDGGPEGELEYETFNAASLDVTIQGKDVHPGTATGVMVNAILLAMRFQMALPQAEVPEKTAGREGFFLLQGLDGHIDQTKMSYIIRDHDRQKFEARKALAQKVADDLNAELGEDRISIVMKDQYYNMREVLEEHMDVVDLADQAMKALNIKPIIEPVRGGTDGSKISFMGLPTPNIFAGGENMHGRYEYVSIQAMEKATDVLLKIIELTTNKTK